MSQYEQWADLAEAVITQAAEDYIRAARNGSNKRIEQLERFFRGPVFAKITDIDPEKLIERLREKTKDNE